MSLLKRNLLLLISLVFIFISCNKQRKVKYIPLDKDLKEKFNLKKGSYWIYRDSINGRLDSCYLSEIQLYITGFERGDLSPYEKLTLTFKQIPKDTTIKELIYWSLYFTPGEIEGAYYKIINNTEVFRQNTFGCNYPIPYKSTEIKYTDYKGETKGIINYTLNSNLFDTAYSIYTYSLPIPGLLKLYENTNYINDSIGYLKMCINIQKIKRTPLLSDTNRVNEVWELQRWKIVK